MICQSTGSPVEGVPVREEESRGEDVVAGVDQSTDPYLQHLVATTQNMVKGLAYARKINIAKSRSNAVYAGTRTKCSPN